MYLFKSFVIPQVYSYSFIIKHQVGAKHCPSEREGESCHGSHISRSVLIITSIYKCQAAPRSCFYVYHLPLTLSHLCWYYYFVNEETEGVEVVTGPRLLGGG